MVLKSIKLENFRNYENISVDIGPNITILYGENGQGKTNLLESIYLCTCARSHRTAKDSELIRKGSSFYSAQMIFSEQQSYVETIRINYAMDGKTGKRTMFHDGIQLNKLSEIMGIFNAVLFSPEDLMIIKDGPSAKRRFLDLMICQFSPSYFNNLQRYYKLVKQRNALLKIYRENPPENILYLESLHELLADLNFSIFSKRTEVMLLLEESLKKNYTLISKDREKIGVKYKTNVLKEEKSVEYIKQRLNQSIKDDIFRGATSIGIHRDDLEFFMNKESVKTFSSQGQQRSLVLSLKIAELEIIKNYTNRKPVLLLDDVFSELDPMRRKALFSLLSDSQVVITCTHIDQVKDFLHAGVMTIEIENAQIKAIKQIS